MSRADAPPRKKSRTDPVSLQRQQLDFLEANADADHTSLPAKAIPESLRPPPDFVNSIQGSSSGAGSGEFHVYKASRRREYERMSLMDAENEQEMEDRLYQQRRAEQKSADDAKTEKNRRKREKAKLAREKAAQAEKERKTEKMHINTES